MVGDGPELAEAKALATALGVGEAIHWAGRQSEVAPFYRQAHLLVQPSQSEACPLTVLEAYACGTPVVGTRVGGMTELLGCGAGLAVPLGSIDGLADALQAVLGDQVRWQAMQAQGVQAVHRCWTPERIVAAYCRAYEVITAGTDSDAGLPNQTGAGRNLSGVSAMNE